MPRRPTKSLRLSPEGEQSKNCNAPFSGLRPSHGALLFSESTGRLMNQVRRRLDSLDHLAHLEGLLQEAVITRAPQALALAVGELAAHRDDLGELQLLVLPHAFGEGL